VRLDESLNYIKQAVSLEPNNGAYLDSLGWALLQDGQVRPRGGKPHKGSAHMGSDPTVQEHLGDLYQKTGRLKLAAAHWERAVAEWNKTVPAEVDNDALAKSSRNSTPPKSAWRRTIRQAVASDEVPSTDFLSVLAAQYSVLSARARLSKCWPATPYTWNNRVDAASLSLLTLPRRLPARPATA